jgi:hypothetical protein
VIRKNESRRRLLADHGHDIGLAERVAHIPAVSGLFFEQFQPDDRLFGEPLEHGLQLMLFRAERFSIQGAELRVDVYADPNELQRLETSGA